MGRKRINPDGKSYGRWTVRHVDPSNPKRYVCLCDPERGGCGLVRSVDAGSLRQGKSTMCRSCSSAEQAARPNVIPNLRPGTRADGDAERARHGLPPLEPGQVPLRRRGRLGYPALRALCDRAEGEGWTSAQLIAELRRLST